MRGKQNYIIVYKDVTSKYSRNISEEALQVWRDTIKQKDFITSLKLVLSLIKRVDSRRVEGYIIPPV